MEFIISYVFLLAFAFVLIYPTVGSLNSKQEPNEEAEKQNNLFQLTGRYIMFKPLHLYVHCTFVCCVSCRCVISDRNVGESDVSARDATATGPGRVASKPFQP